MNQNIVKKIYKIIVLLICIFTGSHAQAKWVGSSLGENSSSGSSSGIKFRLLTGLKLQHGDFGATSSGDSEKRSMNAISVDGAVGISWHALILGVGGEYAKWYQMTDPDERNGSNLSGTQKNISLVAGLALGKFCVIYKHHFQSEFEISNKSKYDDQVSYISPEKAYSIALLYRPGGRFYWGLDYSTVTYSKESRGGDKYDLSSSYKMSLSALGITYGFMF